MIITGAGGSGVLLSDAIVDNGLSLMEIPPDLDEAFREFIPPFGAAGNPVDITGGEPPSTYEATIRLGLEDPRIHALVLGYWHTIVTPPMVFAELTARVVAEVPGAGHREAGGGVARGRHRGRGGVPVPLRARRRRVPVHDREAGGRARREVPLGAGGGAAAGPRPAPSEGGERATGGMSGRRVDD